jgi:hypothetical protein
MKILSLNFSFKTSLTCIIMSILVMVKFGCVGTLVWLKCMFWVVRTMLFVFVFLF